jgi:hypothetical protein
MGWVRFNRRYGAWPGLAALVLQIVLSFGHIHIGNVHIEGGVRALSAALTDSHPVTLASAKATSNKQSPAQNSGDDGDYCAICASIFLASTSLAAQPPILPVPLGFARVAPTFDADAGIGASPPAFFRSRAPPTA